MGSRGGGRRRSGRRHAAGRRGGRACVPVQPGRTHLRDSRHVHARGGEPRGRVHRRRLHRVPAAPGAVSHPDRRSAQRARDAAASRLSGQACGGRRARARSTRRRAMIALEPDFLCGSYPPLITPFRGGDVDYDSYASLIEHQIANGTHGVVVNGTTSEPTSLTVDERNRLVRTAVEVAGGRIPVVAQTGSQSHAETVALTEFAARAGADALMVLTPYFIRAPQRGVVAYFEDLAKRSSLPLLMYHIPVSYTHLRAHETPEHL